MNAETLAAVNAKAAEFGVPASHLAAMVEVESGGRIFGFKRRPMILFEPHVFYRRLRGEERDRAVAAGLAYPKWGTKPYPRKQEDRWSQIERGALINHDAAYESASYGVGQVMGYHWRALGYTSLQDFLDTVQSGVHGQIDAMLRYLRVNSLMDDLKAGRWLTVARGYNGKGQAKRYARLLENAARKFGAASSDTEPGMLRMGSKGARVRELQALLVRAGYQVTVDGDFGPATRKALVAFQKAEGLKPDGVYGPKTEAALGAYRQGPDDKPGREQPLENGDIRSGATKIGAGVGVEMLQNKVDEATGALQTLDGFQPWLGYGIAVLSVMALGLAAWGAYQGIKGWLDSQKTVEA